jgi:prolyl-tRNA editing enzyme YbaK/EbsC (Cys-tRNA(Pro) deacylase)
MLSLLGLAGLVGAILNVRLDKTQQISMWGDRPLSTNQLHYAALDAHILLEAAGQLEVRLAASPSIELECKNPVDSALPIFSQWAQALNMVPLTTADVTRALRELVGEDKWQLVVDTPSSGAVSTAPADIQAANCEVSNCEVSNGEVSNAQVANSQVVDDGSTNGGAASALENGRVVKTLALVVLDDINTKVRVVCILDLKHKLDLTAVGREVFGVSRQKLRMALDGELVAEFGYSHGGVGPFGLRDPHTVVVMDEGVLEEGGVVLLGAGAADTHIAISPAEVVRACKARVACVRKKD